MQHHSKRFYASLYPLYLCMTLVCPGDNPAFNELQGLRAEQSAHYHEHRPGSASSSGRAASLPPTPRHIDPEGGEFLTRAEFHKEQQIAGDAAFACRLGEEELRDAKSQPEQQYPAPCGPARSLGPSTSHQSSSQQHTVHDTYRPVSPPPAQPHVTFSRGGYWSESIHQGPPQNATKDDARLARGPRKVQLPRPNPMPASVLRPNPMQASALRPNPMQEFMARAKVLPGVIPPVMPQGPRPPLPPPAKSRPGSSGLNPNTGNSPAKKSEAKVDIQSKSTAQASDKPSNPVTAKGGKSSNFAIVSVFAVFIIVCCAALFKIKSTIKSSIK